jgi:hypothetical protein
MTNLSSFGVSRRQRGYTATLFAEVFDWFNANNFPAYRGNIVSSGLETLATENPKRIAQFGFRFEY